MAFSIEEIVEDLITLEVATLTKDEGSIQLDKQTISAEDQEVIDEVQKHVNDARTTLMAAYKKVDGEELDSGTMKAARKAYRRARKDLNDVKQSLGVYNPKDIFSHIRAGLSQADLVGYSRFELEGDSVNFVSNKDSHTNLYTMHQDFVKSAQASRSSLIKLARSIGSSSSSDTEDVVV
ncbi:MAG: hypothetical protein ACPGJS_22880 [Flammeovirgaceae bacterium]